MTKVVHIVEALGGGIYSYFIDLSNYFGKKDNLNTTVIYSDKRPEIIPDKVRQDFHENIGLIPKSMSAKISFFEDFKTLIFLTKQIKVLKPDVIHLHSSKMSVIGRLAYLFSFSEAKLYYTPHGYSFLKKDIPALKQKVFYLIERCFAKIGGSTIACGDTEFSYAKKFGKSYLIRNGIDLSEIKKIKKTQSSGRITIGILGRITFARNPKLFNTIAIMNPDIDFLWIGDGDLREHITAKNITITGWFMDRQKGLERLNDIDVYMQTSLWEGLPIAPLEAMSLKKPVLATNIIGNKDIVKHGETGFLFEDPKQAKEYIDLLRNKKLRLKLGENAFVRVKDYFNCNKNFNTLEKVYLNE
jgi:glycosyltransferase involved in cell wall biosynthesis